MSFEEDSSASLQVKSTVMMISLKGHLTNKAYEKYRSTWFDTPIERQVSAIEIYFQNVKSIDHQFMHQLNGWMMRAQVQSAKITIRGASRSILEIMKLCQSNHWASFE